MADLAKALQQPEYVHVLLNHLPITGLFVAWSGLVVAVALNNRFATRFSLVLVAALSLSVWPVAHYGEEAYDRVLSMTDEVGGQYLEHHQTLAERWIFLYYVTAAAAVAALVVNWKRPRGARWSAGAVIVLAAASLVAGAVIAEYGGPARHREFRYGPSPAKTPE